jgi:hypothetical protein
MLNYRVGSLKPTSKPQITRRSIWLPPNIPAKRAIYG